MHRTSTVGLTIGTIATAAGAVALTALTGAGAGGAYAFLFVGMLVFMVFLIWPERTRPFRGGRRDTGVPRVRTGHEPR
jgi:hypothetical protein